MAIWQFQIYLIPREVIYNKYGFIPEQLHIDNEKRETNFKDSELSSDYSFEDALTILWWEEKNIHTDYLFPIIGEIAPILPSYNGLQHFGNADSDDVSVCFNQHNNLVEEVSSRIDLRSFNITFIEGLISLLQHFDCLMMDKKGRLLPPTIEVLMKAIKLSNSYKFVNDPQKFLTDMSQGIIKPE